MLDCVLVKKYNIIIEMKTSNIPRKWWVRLSLFTLFALSITVVRGTSFLSFAKSNAGFSKLIQTTTMGSCGTSQQPLRQAEFFFRQAKSIDVENRSAQRGLGMALAAQNRKDEAVVAWTSINDWRTQEVMSQLLINCGEHKRALKQYKESLSWYKAAGTLTPNIGDSYYYIGIVQANMGLPQDALVSLEQTFSMPLTVVGRSDVYYQIGWLQFRKSDPREMESALAAINRAIELDDFRDSRDQTLAHFERGDILRNLGLLNEARQEFEYVLSYKPHHYYSHVWLGSIAWKEDNDIASAEDYLTRAISSSPKRETAYLWLGLMYEQTQQLPKAKTVYSQVITLYPSNHKAQDFLSNYTNN